MDEDNSQYFEKVFPYYLKESIWSTSHDEDPRTVVYGLRNLFRECGHTCERKYARLTLNQLFEEADNSLLDFSKKHLKYITMLVNSILLALSERGIPGGHPILHEYEQKIWNFIITWHTQIYKPDYRTADDFKCMVSLLNQ